MFAQIIAQVRWTIFSKVTVKVKLNCYIVQSKELKKTLATKPLLTREPLQSKRTGPT